MRIEELHLKNFRCFKELDIKFPESNLAVFIGWNGSGKTAILDVIVSSLVNLNKHHGVTIYIKNEIFSDNNIKNELFSDNDINIESNEFNVNINMSCNSYSVSWNIFKNRENEPKIDNIKGSISEIEKEFMNAPNFTINQYTAKREKKFVHQGSPILVRIDDFNAFKKQFIEEVNVENRRIIEEQNFSLTNPKLNVIRKAIEKFFSNISNMRISKLRTKDIGNTTHIVLNWDDKDLNLSQLSEGQRGLLLLISDIAFSLINDPSMYAILINSVEPEVVLDRKGIILIDEIELHLHPQWQREILPALQKTFPNIQFIVTTHSPQVLSSVHRDDIFILDNNQIYQPSSNPIGRDSTDILYEIMEVTKRPEEIQQLSDEYFALINKNQFEEAQKIREQLLVLVKDKKLDEKDPIFIRADGILARKQLLKR